MFNEKREKDIDPWDMPDTTCYSSQEHNTHCREDEPDPMRAEQPDTAPRQSQGEPASAQQPYYQNPNAAQGLQQQADRVKVLGIIAMVLTFLGGGIVGLLLAVCAIAQGRRLSKTAGDLPAIKTGVICAYIALGVLAITVVFAFVPALFFMI